MNATSLPVPATFCRMIEAHGEGRLIDSFFFKRPSVGKRMAQPARPCEGECRAQHKQRAGRPVPIEILKRQDATRMPKLVPVRYGRMLADPICVFARLGCGLASDLSVLPISGTPVVACGEVFVAPWGTRP